MIIFPDLPNVQVERVEVAEEITLTLRTTSPTASCPSCGTVSSRIQSRYTRTLRDLPSAGRPIRLIMHVRRFFCKKSTCAQKIFTERLPEVCQPYAQRTKRLQEALCLLGLAAGGQAGAEIGSEQGINGSRDTILRLVRRHHLPDLPKSPIVGIDDWSWKRRQRYGTLICDLESHQPIDLLSDRSVETVSAWFQARPYIEIVSRDGSSEYASAIKKCAPQARQVSDRWHLVKNLAACVSVQLAQCLTQLRRTEQARANTSEGEHSSREQYSHPRTRAEQRTQQARQAERLARYEHITALFKQGMKSAEIAAQTGMRSANGSTLAQPWHPLFPPQTAPSAPARPLPNLSSAALEPGMSQWVPTGSGTESKRLQRVRARGLSLLSDLGTICISSRDAVQYHPRARILPSPHPTQSAQDAVCPTGNLALFPQT
jgi:transposase